MYSVPEFQPQSPEGLFHPDITYIGENIDF